MNIRDAQDSFEAGRRRWEGFIADVEMRWNTPLMLEEMIIQLRELPPEVKARLPEDTRRRLEKMLGGNYATQR